MANFYKTTKWVKKREKILRRDEYICCECRRYGKATQATTVHHCNPLSERPDLRLCSLNLISVCEKCHGTFHDKNTNVLTDKGEQWRDRANRLIDQQKV